MFFGFSGFLGFFGRVLRALRVFRVSFGFGAFGGFWGFLGLLGFRVSVWGLFRLRGCENGSKCLGTTELLEGSCVSSETYLRWPEKNVHMTLLIWPRASRYRANNQNLKDHPHSKHLGRQEFLKVKASGNPSSGFGAKQKCPKPCSLCGCKVAILDLLSRRTHPHPPPPTSTQISYVEPTYGT